MGFLLGGEGEYRRYRVAVRQVVLA